MKRKVSRKLVVAGLAAAIVLGCIGGGTAMAAETYQPVTLNSYGVFSYDDGNSNNNNGYKYDIFLDSSDLTKINNNLNVLKVSSDALSTKVDNLTTQITNVTGQVQDISGLKSDVATLKTDVTGLKTSVNTLNTDVDNLETEVEECFQSVSNGKALLASTLTDLGVETASDATFETIDNNIKELATKTTFSGTIVYTYHYHDSDCKKLKCGGTQNLLTSGTESNGSITAQYKCAKCGYVYTYHNLTSAPSTYSEKCAARTSSYSCGYSDGEIIGATITYD